MYLRWLTMTALLALIGFTPLSCRQEGIKIGSKKFTESVILGEMAAQLLEADGIQALHYQELGGTALVFEALKTGQVDIYPEYTGTIREELFSDETFPEDEAGELAKMRELLAAQGVRMSEPLGFSNSYGIGIRPDLAEEKSLGTISDLTRFPELRFGFSNEFMDRSDGWPALRKAYGLPQTNVRGMDHDLAYRQLSAGGIDATEVYTTDAKIDYYKLKVLEDDRKFFPSYNAVFLYRSDLADRAPAAIQALDRVQGKISEQAMMAMNMESDLLGEPESVASADFLRKQLGIQTAVHVETRTERIWKYTLEHLELVRQSLVAAILLAIPLGVLAAKRAAIGQVILGAVGIVQTIPALALLVMLIGPVSQLGLTSVGSGSATAVIALFLYSLLPIVRNTYVGLHDIPGPLRESAEALGLPPSARLGLVEMPIASRTILAGIKTAAVINVGFATLGALIGAGGYGQPILTGIRRDDTGLILEGAIPAAVLAIAVQGLFELAERRLVPKGLRL